jgi:hypothetical protein
MNTTNACAGGNQAMTVAVPQQQTGTAVVTIERDATANDIPKLQTPSLEVFSVEFTDIPTHEKGGLDVERLNAYAKQNADQLGVDIEGI